MSLITKYDLKSNKKFFVSTILVYIIFLLAIFSVKTVGNVDLIFDAKVTNESLIILQIIIFSLSVIYFAISSFQKDLNSDRGLLSFTLPIKMSTYYFSKLLVINLFYLLLVLFLTSSMVFGFKAVFKVEYIAVIILYLFILNVISSVTFMFLEIRRFIIHNHFKVLSFFLGIVIFTIIFAGAFLIASKFSFNTDFTFSINDGYGIDFLYPVKHFSVNLIAYIYYFIVTIIFSAIDIRMLNKSLDLS